MKKLLLFTAIAAITTITHAQEVKFGAKAGVNFATVVGDETGDVKARTSFHIGGVFEFITSEKFSIQPEIIYSSQGFRFEDASPFGDYKETYMLDYINVPIMAKFYVVEGLSFEAGPQMGILTSSKFKAELGGETDEGDIEDGFSTFDFAVGLGAAYRLPMGLFFSARYNVGVSNIFDGQGSSQFKNKNNVFQISTGIRI